MCRQRDDLASNRYGNKYAISTGTRFRIQRGPLSFATRNLHCSRGLAACERTTKKNATVKFDTDHSPRCARSNAGSIDTLRTKCLKIYLRDKSLLCGSKILYSTVTIYKFSIIFFSTYGKKLDSPSSVLGINRFKLSLTKLIGDPVIKINQYKITNDFTDRDEINY